MARKKATTRKKASRKKAAAKKGRGKGPNTSGLRPPTPEMVERAKQRRRAERDRKIRRFLEARRRGVLAKKAAELAGISQRLVWEWREKVPGFREREERAIQDGFEEQLARLERIADEQEHEKPDTAIRATETYLRYTKGPLTRSEVSGPSGGPVEVRRADAREQDLAEAVDRWARRLGVEVDGGDAGGPAGPGAQPRP